MPRKRFKLKNLRHSRDEPVTARFTFRILPPIRSEWIAADQGARSSGGPGV
jgi:hypothetical protein